MAWASDPGLTEEQRDDSDAATIQVLDALASAIVIGVPTDEPVEVWPAFAVVAERLLVLTERRGTVKQQAQALNIQAWNLHAQGARQVAMTLWRQAASITRAAGRAWEGAVALVNLSAFSVPYDLSDARAFGEEALELAERVNDRWLLALARGNLGEVCWLAGEWARLRTLADRVRAGESIEADLLLLLAGLVADATGGRAAPEGADRAAVDDEQLDPDMRAWSLMTQEISRPRADAATVERAVIIHHSGAGMGDEFWSLWTFAIDLLLERDDFERCHRLVELVESADTIDVSPLLRAQLLRARGELARREGNRQSAAESDLVAGVRALDDFGARFYAARARVSLGQFLLEAGRSAEAGEPLDGALRIFEELGALPWHERARRLLSSGLAAGGLVGEGSAGLSPR